MRCSEALILDRLQVTDIHTEDYRLSILVDQKVYDEASRSLAAGAILYGVPVSGSYSEYNERAMELRSRYENTYSRDDALSVSWSGLSKNSAESYKACLASHNVMQGLSLELVDASDEEIVISLHWKKGIGGRKKIGLNWQGDTATIANLPDELSDAPEGLPFVIKRPRDGSYFLAVQGVHSGDPILGDFVKISAVTTPVEVERLPTIVASWAAKIGNSIIDEKVPIEAIGRKVKFNLQGRASSQSGGSMQAIIAIDGNEVFATDRRYAGDNPELNLTTHEVSIPLLARRARIEFKNWDSVAAFGRAELVC
jgi:hypothetical protein